MDRPRKTRPPISEETRQKLRNAKLGRPRDPATIEAIRLGNTGQRRSDETKTKISLAMTGRKRKPFSEETKQKMREAQRRRRESESPKESVSHRAQCWSVKG